MEYIYRRGDDPPRIWVSPAGTDHGLYFQVDDGRPAQLFTTPTGLEGTDRDTLVDLFDEHLVAEIEDTVRRRLRDP